MDKNNLIHVAFLLTEFPNQTSIAMWRVAKATREMNVEVSILSTRKPGELARCHSELEEDAKKAFYCWPPKFGFSLAHNLAKPMNIYGILNYVLDLRQSNWIQKIKVLFLAVPAAGLVNYCNQKKITHIVVHSCANAAHLASLTRLLGGPKFSLRLGGDLEVYGVDHQSKFKNATFAIPASVLNQKQILDNSLIHENKLFATWLGVNTNKFIPNISKCDSSTIRIVTIARLNRNKGHIFALEAIAKLLMDGYEVRYDIAGAGDYESTLRSEITRLKIDKAVTLYGQVDERKAISLLQSSDIFLLSSFGIGEASPVSLIEAMSCGLPVISTSIGGIPQIIENDVDGILIAPENSFEILSVLKMLIEDESKRDILSKNARKSAVEYFDCRIVAEALIKAIKLSLSEPHFSLTELSPINRKLADSST